MIKQKLIEERASASVVFGISILLSLSLIFSGLQLQRILSKSATIQDCADSASLSGQSQVEKFYAAVSFADTALLTLNIVQVSLYATGIVAACAGQAPTSAKLLSNAGKVGSARKKFCEQAKNGLTAYQNALPAIIAATSSKLCQLNASADEKYWGMCVPVPLKGKKVTLNYENVDKVANNFEDGMEDVQNKGVALRKAEEQCDKLKEEAYMLDCGNMPNFCLYERAQKLADMSHVSNPYYSSPDSWNFDVALRRSLAYFENRAQNESPQSFDNIREQSRSYLRKDYYNYAIQEIKESLADSSRGDKSHIWPDIYHEKDGFRSSSRYAQSIYPVTEKEGVRKMHSNVNLACASSWTYLASCKDFDEGEFEKCEFCEFSTANTGNIGSATTNTLTGFEHYFHKIGDLNRRYVELEDGLDQQFDEMKKSASSAIDKLKQFAKEAYGARFYTYPPGAEGCIAIVSDGSTGNIDDNDFVAFAKHKLNFGTHNAISASKLKKDDNSKGSNAVANKISSICGSALDDIKDAWKRVAESLSSGQNAQKAGYSSASKSLCEGNSTGSTGGRWADGELQKVSGETSPQISDLTKYKAVLVNSSSVVENSESEFAKRFYDIQQAVRNSSTSSADLFSGMITQGEQNLIEKIDSSVISVTNVEIPLIGKLEINKEIPSDVADGAKTRVSEVAEKIRSGVRQVSGVKPWQ